jgi:hypothetical protein
LQKLLSFPVITQPKENRGGAKVAKNVQFTFSQPVHRTFDSLLSLYHSSVLLTWRSLRLCGMFFSVLVAEAAE